MRNPIHATTLGPITGEQQLGFFEGFALLLGLLLPIAVKELMGSEQIALPEICAASLLANPLQLGARRPLNCRQNGLRGSNLGWNPLGWNRIGAGPTAEQQEWQWQQ
jgi:hypothetical protein